MIEGRRIVQQQFQQRTCIRGWKPGVIAGFWLGWLSGSSGAMAKDVAFVQTMPRGKTHWSLQDRSRIGLGSRLEVTTALSGWLFASPNLGIRAGLLPPEQASRQLHAEIRLALPTPTILLTQGYLFPSGEGRSKKVPWVLVPGFSLTWAIDLRHVQWTIRSDLAYGVWLSGTVPSALETYAPIELALAPVSRSFRGDLETGLGIPALTWLDILIQFRASIVGMGALQSSPWIYRSKLGVQFHVGDHWALQLSASWYNYDQGRIRHENIGDGFVRNYRVRSHEVWPTIGVVWRPRASKDRFRSGPQHQDAL